MVGEHVVNYDPIVRAFVDRLKIIGIDHGRFSDFLNSFIHTCSSELDRNLITKIIKDTDGGKSLEHLTAKQTLFLDRLFTRNVGVHILSPSISMGSTELVRRIANVFAVLIFIGVATFLFAAILAGHSGNTTFAQNPVFSLVIFLGLNFVLFLLEGTQISLTSLRLKDLDHIRITDPKTHTFQSNFRHLEEVNAYLSGRQLFTIACIFIISQITVFPDLETIPFTQISIPHFLDVWLSPVFLHFGFLGALFTLWVGQLTPQFLAAKRPVGFLRLPLAKGVITISRVLKSLGISKIAELIVGGVSQEADIPTSNREKLYSFRNAKGYVGLGLSLKWIIKKDSVELVRKEEIEFFSNTIDLLKTSQIIPKTYKTGQMESHFEVNRHGDPIDVDVVDQDEHDEYDSHFIISRISPRHGGFLPGDIVTSSLSLSMQTIQTMSHHLRPSLPVRYLSLEIVIDPDVGIRAPKLIIREPELLTDNYSLDTELSLSQTALTDGVTRFHKFIMFPDSDADYEIYWQLH